MVGLETLKLRRELKKLAHYCLLLRHKMDNPSVLEKRGLFDRYTSVAGRSTWRARNFFGLPFGTHHQSHSKLNEFLAQIREAVVFADKWRVLSAALSRFVNLR